MKKKCYSTSNSHEILRDSHGIEKQRLCFGFIFKLNVQIFFTSLIIHRNSFKILTLTVYIKYTNKKK